MGNPLTDNPPVPAFYKSIVRLSCSACGAEANASCNCGKPYVPVQQRVAEYDKANPGRSTRQAAADLGLHQTQVQRSREHTCSPEPARSGVPPETAGGTPPPETVTGRDGKTYPATKPTKSARPTYEPEPGEDDQIDFIVQSFLKLSFQGQTRCAAMLRNIIHQGRPS